MSAAAPTQGPSPAPDAGSGSFLRTLSDHMSGKSFEEEQRLEKLAKRLKIKRRRLPWYANCENCEWPIGGALAVFFLFTGQLNDITILVTALTILVVGVSWPLLRDSWFDLELEEVPSPRRDPAQGKRD